MASPYVDLEWLTHHDTELQSARVNLYQALTMLMAYRETLSPALRSVISPIINKLAGALASLDEAQLPWSIEPK